MIQFKKNVCVCVCVFIMLKLTALFIMNASCSSCYKVACELFPMVTIF